MPYKSRAQQGYFNANRDELESQGVNVDEWNESSKGMKLPKKATSSDPKSDVFKPRKKRLFGKFPGAGRV